MPGNTVATGLDRAGWIRFGTVAVLGPVALVLLAGFAVFVYRRRRS